MGKMICPRILVPVSHNAKSLSQTWGGFHSRAGAWGGQDSSSQQLVCVALPGEDRDGIYPLENIKKWGEHG